MFVVTALSIGLYFYYSGQKTNALWRYYLSGLAIGFTLEAHNFSIRFILIFAIIMSINYLLQIKQEKRFIWYKPFYAFALGGITFGVFYISFHMLLFGIPLDEYFRVGVLAYRSESEIPGVIAATDFSQRLQLVSIFFQDYLMRHPIEISLVIIAWISALWRRQSHDLFLLMVSISSLVLLLFLLPKHNIYYYINLLPMTTLLLAGLFQSITRLNPMTKTINAVVPVTLISLAMIFSVQTYRVSQAYELGTDFITSSYIMDEVIAPEIEHIAAWDAYYYGLSSRSFVSTLTFTDYIGQEWETELGIPPPQAIIYTPGLDNWYENITLYIEETGMVRTRCWYLRHFGFVSLYILPDLAPPERDLYCQDN